MRIRRIVRTLAFVIPLLLPSIPVWAIHAEHQAPQEDMLGSDNKLIEVLQTGESESSILDPQNRVWKSAPSTEIPLYSQSVVEPYGGGSTGSVSISSLQTKAGLAVRLQWLDSTKDDAGSARSYKDAAAVQYPIAQTASLAMGHPEKPVSIWHWMAALQGQTRALSKQTRIPLQDKVKSKTDLQSCVEELVAAGHQNKAPQPDHLTALYGNAVWQNGIWSLVIFKANLEGRDSSPVFSQTHKLPVAFAIWNGSEGDNHGKKSISNWAELHFVQH